MIAAHAIPALVVALVAAQAAAPQDAGASPEVLLRALRSAAPGGARAAAATRALHGLPYARSPLGEGEGPDADPRFRLDAFDCWTFVETAVALSSAATLDEARIALDDVRYAGEPALASRNHEVMSQWVPRNVRRGWIRDVTHAIAGPLARPAAKEFDAASWRAVARAGRALPGVPPAALPRGRFALDVVPLALAGAIEERIPAGALLLVVRADAPERPTRVSHAGIVFLGPRGGRWVRHATSTPGVARVVEEPLARFLARQEKGLLRWPPTGIAVLAVRDNRARVAALAAARRAFARVR